MTKDQIKNYLEKMGMNQPQLQPQLSLMSVYKLFVQKEKNIYFTLNKLVLGDRLLHGLFWKPTKMEKELDDALHNLRENRNLQVP